MIQEALSRLHKHGDVYIKDSSIFNDNGWRSFQENEMRYWNYLFGNVNFDPHSHWLNWFKPLLKYWGVDTNFFKGKSVIDVGAGPYCIYSSINLINPDHLPGVMVITDPLMDFYQQFEVQKAIPDGTIKVKCPGEDLPFDDKSFDVAICTGVIDHVQNPHKLIHEISRVLKKDGSFLFSVHVIRSFISPLEPFLKRIDTNHPYHFTLPQMSELFKMNNFRVSNVTCQRIDKQIIDNYAFPKRRNMLWRMIKSFGYYMIIMDYTGYAVPAESCRRSN